MTMLLHRSTVATLNSLGPREFSGIAATSELQDDGYALDMRGADLSRFRGGRAPLLWNHDPNRIIGRILSISAAADALLFTATFASEGITPLADEACGLLKDGVLNAVSLGFQIDDAEWIRPGNSNAGRRATKWSAFEISLTAVGVDAAALVTARAFRSGKVLSDSNATKLREAHAASVRCHVLLGDVLSGAGEMADSERAGHGLSERQRELAALSFAGRNAELDHFGFLGRQHELALLTWHQPPSFEQRQRELGRLARSRVR